MLVFAMSLMSSSRTFAQNVFPADSDRPQEKQGRKVQKLDLVYHASEVYLAAGTGLDMMTTAHNLGHPTTAYSARGDFLTHYYAEETGWASVVGRRDTTGVVLANVALNVGIDLLDRKLYKRGGKWKFAAMSLNVLKGTGNIVCGIRNIKTDEGIDQAVQMRTGYKGIVVWSH